MKQVHRCIVRAPYRLLVLLAVCTWAAPLTTLAHANGLL